MQMESFALVKLPIPNSMQYYFVKWIAVILAVLGILLDLAAEYDSLI
jgi:hypothetical protein